MQVDFYHLVASPLERIFPQICEKVIAGGGRLLAVGGDALVDRLDQTLWSYAADAFLPHGLTSGAGAAEQPILLATEVSALNGARNVALVDGRWRDEAFDFDRAFYFFDTAGVDEARTSWRSVKGRDDVEPRYWKQDDSGRWMKAA